MREIVHLVPAVTSAASATISRSDETLTVAASPPFLPVVGATGPAIDRYAPARNVVHFRAGPAPRGEFRP